MTVTAEEFRERILGSIDLPTDADFKERFGRTPAEVGMDDPKSLPYRRFMLWRERERDKMYFHALRAVLRKLEAGEAVTEVAGSIDWPEGYEW